jgi:hypothetical protein
MLIKMQKRRYQILKNQNLVSTPKPSSTPTKRAKIVESRLDLVGAFECGTQTLAGDIKIAVKIVTVNILPDGLF